MEKQLNMADHYSGVTIGDKYFIVVLLTGVLNWITTHQVDEVLKTVYYIIGGGAGIMAFIYHYRANKKLKK